MADASMMAIRAADVLLSCAGGRSVMLRIPAPATAGDVTEQLGLATPEFQDVELASVVFRKARVSTMAGKAAKWELLVSATAVNALVGSLGYSAASVLFEDAFGVLVDGVLMEVEAVTDSQAGGAAYVYRVIVQEPLALVV